MSNFVNCLCFPILFYTFAVMEGNVSDISKAEICRLTRLVESLNATIRKREKEIEELKSKLSQYEKPGKNSTNSSTPPSKEAGGLRTRPGLCDAGRVDTGAEACGEGDA